MRFLFKTSYEQDLTLFGDSVQRNWYAALLVGLLGLPWLFPAYLSDLNLVLIYGLCGLSLMVLAGYTGLVSLGHAAFLGIGAYAHVYFVQDVGLPWIVAVALATALTAAAGVLVGSPALRMTGVYLAIATLAFALIIQEVFTRWDRVTHGLKGRPVDKPVIFGISFATDAACYFLCLGFLIGGLWLTRSLLRARVGAGVERLDRLGPRRRRQPGAVPSPRSPRPAARPGAGHLRRAPGAVHPLRAARHLRPVGDAQGVLLDLSPLQARHLHAPAGV